MGSGMMSIIAGEEDPAPESPLSVVLLLCLSMLALVGVRRHGLHTVPLARWSLGAGVIALSVVLLATSASAQQVPTSEAAFTDFVAQRLRAALRPTPVEIKGPLTLTIGPMQANLDRIHAFCQTDTAGCLREITNYVSGVVQATRTATEKPVKENLRVVVRQATDMQRAAEQLGANGLAATRPLVEGLVIVPVLDSSRTTKVVARPDLAALGLTPDQVIDLGLANVRRRLKPIMTVAKAVPAGQFGHITGDYYESSRLALIDSWAPLAQALGGVLIVAAPSPDLALQRRGVARGDRRAADARQQSHGPRAKTALQHAPALVAEGLAAGAVSRRSGRPGGKTASGPWPRAPANACTELDAAAVRALR